MPDPGPRTLVVHTGGIGDLLLCFAALQHVQGPVDLAGHPDRLALAQAGGVAERVYPADALGLEHLFSRDEDSASADRLRARLQGYGRVILFWRDPDGALARALKRLGVARGECHPGLPDAAWRGHAMDYYGHCLGVRATPFRINTGVPRTGTIALHPGSGGCEKHWPFFDDLADALVAAGHSVRWLAGPAEVDRGLVPRGAETPASLLALADALGAARAYVGNDSGPTHLAACTGTPAVAVFGPTDPAVWAPPGRHVRVCRGMPWPDVREVHRAVALALAETDAG